VGDGPKNVQALFMAAQRDDAVLFVDEADSLLSKRLTSVNAGSDQAINSMRSQLLIALEQFSGVVIFATNLVTNYDPAFETRVRSVEFTMPDVAARRAIWQAHLPARLPRTGVDFDSLAAVDDVCGRDIKNAVVDAAVRAAMDGRTGVTGEELLAAIRRVVAARPPTSGEGAALRPVELTEAEEAELTGRISAALDASRTP
jgi:ATP-dependent 26S proteasome regulatory subunit